MTTKKKQDTKPNADNEEEQDDNVEEVVFQELAAAKKKNSAPKRPRDADNDRFADSRGKKAKRFTEEGYPLYDVKDLRIGEGGGKPRRPLENKKHSMY